MSRRQQANVHDSPKGRTIRCRDSGSMSRWGSLQYDDSNQDNKIVHSEAVFKMLRLRGQINSDDSAGKMEAFNLDIGHIGMGMSKLKTKTAFLLV